MSGSSGYEPRGKVAALLEAMRAKGGAEEWDGDMVARVMGISKAQIGPYLLAAVSNKAIYMQTENGQRRVRLTPFPGIARAAVDDLRIPKYDPAWRPPQMVAPRPGSEQPRVSLASASPAAATPAPAAPPPSPSPAPPVEEVHDQVVDLEAEPEEAAAQEFDFAHWRDGSLTVWGVPENEDGSFTLTVEQLTEIKRRVAWSPA